MTDARLRELERTAPGDPAAGARLLQERLRLGALTRDRLELAAYAGDETARLVLFGSLNPPVHTIPPDLLDVATAPFDTVDLATDAAGRLPSPLPRKFDLARWLRGLSRWGPTVLVRAAEAAGRVALVVWRLYPMHARESAERALDACAAWLACPCKDHERAWEAACDAVGPALLAELSWLPVPRDVAGCVAGWTEDALYAADLAGEERVREAVQRALVTWALGESA